MKWQEILAFAEEQEAIASTIPKIMVQVGHCSRALGAEVVAEKLAALDPSYEVLNVGCDGACFNSPQVMITSVHDGKKKIGRVSPSNIALSNLSGSHGGESDTKEVENFFKNQHRIVMDNCGSIDPGNVYQYITKGGYASLYHCLQTDPDEILSILESSKLRGRGGAYFPVALKWRSARLFKGKQRYIVANGEFKRFFGSQNSSVIL